MIEECCSTCTCESADGRDLRLVRAWVLTKDGSRSGADILICSRCLEWLDADLLEDGHDFYDSDRPIIERHAN